MDKNYEAFKEILDEQIKKIVKKGDITPQELDNVYKATSICLDFETSEAMKKSKEKEKENGYSERGGSYDRGYANDGYSTHYPWWMYGDRSYRGDSYAYKPDWREGTAMGEMHGRSNRYDTSRDRGNSRNSYDEQHSMRSDGYSERNDGETSHRRGRDARTGRYVSRDGGSYDYSRNEEKEHMLDRLESMLDNASTEKDRRAIEQCIDRISR